MSPAPETFPQACERLDIQGTLERIPGTALVDTDPDPGDMPDPGSPTYDGETLVSWDLQRTVTDGRGRPVYVDRDGHEYVWDGTRMGKVVVYTTHAVVPVGVRFPRIWQAIALLRSLR